jgi:cytoskeletal protein RodZ
VGGPLPEESTNRTFVIAAVALGALLLLSLICLGVYALVIAPAQENAAIARQTEIALENTRTASELTQTAQPVQFSPTAPPTNTQAPTSTSTPVVVLPSNTPTTAALPATNTPGGATPTTPRTATPQTLQPAALTATAAQATLLAAQAQTRTPTRTPTRAATRVPTATALPTTGFGDEVGLPSLAAIGGVLLVVIIVARRLRTRLSAE